MAHLQHFDHVGITIADLGSVTAYFVGLGLVIEGTDSWGSQSDSLGPGSRLSRRHRAGPMDKSAQVDGEVVHETNTGSECRELHSSPNSSGAT